MIQSFTRPCPRCGISAPIGQQYCQHCGSPMEASANNPTVMASANNPTIIAGANDPTVIRRDFSSSQKPPVPSDPYSAPTQLASSPVGVPQQPVSNHASPLLAVSTPPLQKKAGRSRLVIATVLILVLLLGTAGYFLMHLIGTRPINVGGSNPDATPPQSPMMTTPLGETITYSSVIITLVNAQQASHFADDNSTSPGGALRLNIHESQAAPLDTGGGTTDPYYGYGKAFNLLLPGGRVIAPDSTKIVSGPTGKGSQDNWLDFSVSTGVKVNQLILRIGDSNEAQMDVPLTANANLSAYQPKVVHFTTRVPYGDTFWTLTTASKQWSNGGKQAGSGQRFLVVAVNVDNPSSSDVNAFPPDYVRLQVGGNQIAEANDNFPTGFVAGTTGSKGLVAFLVPQESTSFSFVLLGNGTAHASSPTTIPFAIP